MFNKDYESSLGMGKTLEKVMAPQEEVSITFFLPYDLWERFNRGVRTKKTTKRAVLTRAIETWLEGRS